MALKKVQLVTNCSYCKDKKDPDFMNAQELNKFITERGKIQPRSRTSLCAKHQRKITEAIKRARYIAILPFTVRPE